MKSGYKILLVALVAILPLSGWHLAQSERHAYRTLERAPPRSDDTGIAVKAFDGSKLTLEFDSRKEIIKVDPLLPEQQNIEGAPGLVRYFSPALYKFYGQDSGGIFILSRGLSKDEIHSGDGIALSKDYAPVRKMTVTDESFIQTHSFLSKNNGFAEGVTLCAHTSATDMMTQIQDGDCYVACAGMAHIANQTVDGKTRIVALYGKQEDIDFEHKFLWSEWHSVIEIKDEDGWYFADPTFSLVYVTQRGVRISTERLIDILDKGELDDVSFAVVSEGVIREVPGPEYVAAEPMIAGAYLTPDKEPQYTSPNRSSADISGFVTAVR